MSRLTRTQREVLIWELMNAFPASVSQVSDGVIRAYVEAVMDCSDAAIVKSVTQYRSGLVEAHSGAYVPSAPDFARNCRMWETALKMIAGSTAPERLVAYPIGAEPPPPMVALGPTKLEVGGIMRDVSHLTTEQKDEVLKTGKMPDEPSTPMAPRLRRM